MTRFKKEMAKRFPSLLDVHADPSDETETYVIEEKAFVVLSHPSIVICYQVERSGELTDVSDDHPEITSPYLCQLCGSVEKARQILQDDAWNFSKKLDTRVSIELFPGYNWEVESWTAHGRTKVFSFTRLVYDGPDAGADQALWNEVNEVTSKLTNKNLTLHVERMNKED